MAFAKRTGQDSVPVPGPDPGVVSIHLVNTATGVNVPIKVPWNSCQLSYVYSLVTNVAVDNTGAWVITLKKTDSSGTTIGTCSPAQNAAIGTVTEWTCSSVATSKDLHNYDIININSDGSSSAAGECQMYFYFEPNAL
jgi:hypothetical protein